MLSAERREGKGKGARQTRSSEKLAIRIKENLYKK